MPPKKNDLTYSINPELYARAHRPAATIAMGMKGSHASAHSWAVQVKREEDIRDSWMVKYDPADRQAEEAMQALERTQARDAAKHDAYTSPTTNPELHALLYKKSPTTTMTATASALPSAESTNTAMTAADATTATAGSELQSSTTAATTASMDAASRRVRRAAAAYLEARCDHHTLQQRFPDGPATAAQGVGWDAATAAASGKPSVSAVSAAAALAYAPPNRRSAGAYRKPEDDDHAALLGFDYKVK